MANLFQFQRKLTASGNCSCVCDISVPCQHLKTFWWNWNSVERKTNLFTICSVNALVIPFIYFYSFNYAACFMEKLSDHARLDHLSIRICRNLSFKSMSFSVLNVHCPTIGTVFAVSHGVFFSNTINCTIINVFKCNNSH